MTSVRKRTILWSSWPGASSERIGCRNSSKEPTLAESKECFCDETSGAEIQRFAPVRGRRVVQELARQRRARQRQRRAAGSAGRARGVQQLSDRGGESPRGAGSAARSGELRAGRAGQALHEPRAADGRARGGGVPGYDP